MGLLLGGGEYRLIIDAGKDDNAQCYMRLVLLPLLDCAISGIEIGGRGETLETLPQEIAIRHRMPEDGFLPASRNQRDSQRAIADLLQTVPTAVTAITGRAEASIVRCGPSNVKSAPAASAREAQCMTCSWVTSP